MMMGNSGMLFVCSMLLKFLVFSLSSLVISTILISYPGVLSLFNWSELLLILFWVIGCHLMTSRRSSQGLKSACLALTVLVMSIARDGKPVHSKDHGKNLCLLAVVETSQILSTLIRNTSKFVYSL